MGGVPIVVGGVPIVVGGALKVELAYDTASPRIDFRNYLHMSSSKRQMLYFLKSSD